MGYLSHVYESLVIQPPTQPKDKLSQALLGKPTATPMSSYVKAVTLLLCRAALHAQSELGLLGSYKSRIVVFSKCCRAAVAMSPTRPWVQCVLGTGPPNPSSCSPCLLSEQSLPFPQGLQGQPRESCYHHDTCPPCTSG